MWLNQADDMVTGLQDVRGGLLMHTDKAWMGSGQRGQHENITAIECCLRR